MRSLSRATARARPSDAKSGSILSCVEFQIGHDAGDQLLGIADRFDDYLDIHGRPARRSGALAVDSVLADQHQRVGKNVERNGKLSARLPHHELVLLELVAPLFVDTHVSILGYTR